MQPHIMLKRVFVNPAPMDGVRILVERLWPQGLSREAARIDHWVKELAPSSKLRGWYGHRPKRWPEFRRRYIEELEALGPQRTARLVDLCRESPATLVFAACDTTRNSAVVLREHLLRVLCGTGAG